MKHLWEEQHDYYCNLGNYFKNGCGEDFKTWQEFFDAESDADLDMNLVFRWDWKVRTNDNGDPDPHPDDNYRDAVLEVFFMGQRKGLYRFATVDVCRADEPHVIEYLSKRWEHMKKLWSPFT